MIQGVIRALECCTSHTRMKCSVNSRPSSKCEENLKCFTNLKDLKDLQLICLKIPYCDEEHQNTCSNELVAF